jgi:ABC-2 type transport system permease protein
MASGNSEFIQKTGASWTRGLDSILGGELTGWFKTRKWWTQIITWFFAVNFTTIVVSFTSDQNNSEMPVLFFNIFLGLAGAIGVCIIMQNEVVGEKRSGTAAWVLSKPLSRTAFLLGKMVSNLIGILVTMVLAQGLIAYLIFIFIFQLNISPLNMLAGLAVQLVDLFFYMTLTLMLGTILNHPAPVIAIPIAIFSTQNIIVNQIGASNPTLANLFPWSLVMPVSNSVTGGVASSMMLGVPEVNLIGVVSTLIMSFIFVVTGIMVFNKQDL